MAPMSSVWLSPRSWRRSGSRCIKRSCYMRDCGPLLSMDSTRARETWGDLPPWEQPGGVRRDCEPHRGDLLMRMAAASFACAALGCLTWGITGVLSIGLGLSVLILARRDLVAMSAGRIDPAGEWLTRRARRRSVRAMTLCVGIWALVAAMFLPDLLGASIEARYLGAAFALGLVVVMMKVAVTVH